MPAVPIIAFAVEAGLTVASTIEQKRASDAAATTATQVATYNNKLDQSEAAQVDADSIANIQAMRRDADVYMSRQTSAYVANGVRADTGSPLAVRAITAGRFEMREQQSYNDAQAKEERLYSEGEADIAEGAAKADEYHMQGVAAVLGGAAKVAGLAFGAYESGAFASAGTNDLSAGLKNIPAAGSTDLPAINAGGIA